MFEDFTVELAVRLWGELESDSAVESGKSLSEQKDVLDPLSDAANVSSNLLTNGLPERIKNIL